MDEQALHQSIKQAIISLIATNNGKCPNPMDILIAMRQQFPAQLPTSYPVALQLVVRLCNEVLSESEAAR